MAYHEVQQGTTCKAGHNCACEASLAAAPGWGQPEQPACSPTSVQCSQVLRRDRYMGSWHLVHVLRRQTGRERGRLSSAAVQAQPLIVSAAVPKHQQAGAAAASSSQRPTSEQCPLIHGPTPLAPGVWAGIAALCGTWHAGLVGGAGKPIPIRAFRALLAVWAASGALCAALALHMCSMGCSKLTVWLVRGHAAGNQLLSPCSRARLIHIAAPATTYCFDAGKFIPAARLATASHPSKPRIAIAHMAPHLLARSVHQHEAIVAL